jgi:glycosyltransferase involved in cell wall biosynthesis
MKIFLENVNLSSTSGPNSFAKKIIPNLLSDGCSFVSPSEADVALCFIETNNYSISLPRIQRLDGIYFNTEQDYNQLNSNINKTYKNSKGVIYQSKFSKNLIIKYFGEFENSRVISNGADIETITASKPMDTGPYDNIWSCAASWRPHKRLNENIRYFLEHKGPNDLLVVAGEVPEEKKVSENSVVYFGNLSQNQLYSLYKSSKYFLHLAWLDHCPNVVVDARACGSHVICSSAGGTQEIAGFNATVIEEEEWDFEPTRLYHPPEMDFTKKKKNQFDSCYDISEVTRLYKQFMEETICL